MEKPYIISAEFDAPANSQSAMQNSNLENARLSLDEDLRRMGKSTEWVSAQDLSTGLRRLVSQSALPVVSLDEVYVQNPTVKLGISRGVDESLETAGYVPRSRSYATIAEQLDAVSELGSEVQLVDDVVFSGDMMSWLIEELAARSVRVRRVLAGIAIDEGAIRLDRMGVELDAVRTFSAVEDEICERDLFFARGSGRRMTNASINALYFDPVNGRPEQWASLPAGSTQSFCVTSLERSLRILKPEVPIEAIGAFNGYENQGTAEQVIRRRLAEMENL